MRTLLIFAVLIVHSTLGVVFSTIFPLPEMKLRSRNIAIVRTVDEELHNVRITYVNVCIMLLNLNFILVNMVASESTCLNDGD